MQWSLSKHYLFRHIAKEGKGVALKISEPFLCIFFFWKISHMDPSFRTLILYVCLCTLKTLIKLRKLNYFKTKTYFLSFNTKQNFFFNTLGLDDKYPNIFAIQTIYLVRNNIVRYETKLTYYSH